MTYDFNQHLNTGLGKAPKGMKAFLINAQDAKIIDVTDDMILPDYKTKSFFMNAKGKAIADMLTEKAMPMMLDFLCTDDDNMGSKIDGPMFITVDTHDDLDVPYGFTVPSLGHMINGNGVIFLDEAYLEAGLKSVDHVGELKIMEQIGFFRTQYLPEKKATAIQPDMKAFAWMIAHNYHEKKGAVAKIVLGDPNEDLSKAVEGRSIDVTEALKKLSSKFPKPRN